MSAFDTLEDQLRSPAKRRRRNYLPAVALAVTLLVAVVIARGGEGTAERPAMAPPTAETPLPHDQLTDFAVLRRPPSRADMDPAVDRIVERMGRVRRSKVRVLRAHPLTLLVPVEFQRNRGATIRDQLCLAISNDNGESFGSSCASLTEVRHGALHYTIPPIGLAPDFVKQVKLRVRGGKTLTLTPHNNLYQASKDAYPIQPPRWVR
jgi:hypothetical protein